MKTPKKKHSWPFRILRGLLVSVLSIVILVASAVVFFWFYPGTLITSARVSKFSEKILRPADPLAPGVLPVTLGFEHPDAKTLGIRIAIAPGCWKFGDEKTPSTVCEDEANLELGIRLHRKPILQLAWIGPISVKITRAEIRTASSEPKKPEPPKPKGEPFSFSRYMRYVAPDFHWQSVLIDGRSFRLVDSNIDGSIHVVSTSPSRTLDTLQIRADAKSISPEGSGWAGSFDGTAQRQGARLILPRISGNYRMAGEKPTRIDAELAASFDFEKLLAEGRFDAHWKHPFAQMHSLQADAGTFSASPDGFDVGATLKAIPDGVTPVGRPPVLALRARAKMDRKSSSRIDFSAFIDEYQFAALDIRSDLEFSMETNPKAKERLVWKKGMLRISSEDFGKTVYALRKTAYAIPAPFAVLKGPVLFETVPFRTENGDLFVSGNLTTNLSSHKQVVNTATKVDFAVDSQSLKPKNLAITVNLAQVHLVLPDYDPIAPTPVIGSDPRIQRPEKLKKAAEKRKVHEKHVAEGKPQGALPMRITIESPPSGIRILNRFFEPYAPGEVHLKIEPGLPVDKPGAMIGTIQTSAPFQFHYINRTISIDRFVLQLKPAIEIAATFSMERSGYHVQADFTQVAGRSKISLSSTPLLENDEIVSLILYGVPRSSVTPDQDSSVGSAQAAMSSNALGILSFVALASTPIETILYDPTTQTYSAVVRLPGGVVASIGTSWENDKQVELSKNIGRNWAISTELIQDVNGVNRAGTMLRWRKRY